MLATIRCDLHDGLFELRSIDADSMHRELYAHMLTGQYTSAVDGSVLRPSTYMSTLELVAMYHAAGCDVTFSAD